MNVTSNLQLWATPLFNVINVIMLYGAGHMYTVSISYIAMWYDWHPTVEDVTLLAKHKPISCIHASN